MLKIYHKLFFYLNLSQYSIFNAYPIISLTYFRPTISPSHLNFISAMMKKNGVIIKILGLWTEKPLFRKQRWGYS